MRSLAASAGRLCALVAAAFLAARLNVDPDLWGHLRFGLDLLDKRALASIDPYSFTQDVPWINHEWLSEAIAAAAWRLGGVAGLVLLKSALVGLTVWLLHGFVRTTAPHVRWWLLAATLVSLTPAATTARPQLWTLLGFSALCRLLAGGTRTWWLVPLGAAWANLHGGWTAGAGVAVLWLAGLAIDSRFSARTLGWPAAAIGVAACATLLTPYGWHLWRFLFETMRGSRDIAEWRPIWEQPGVSHALLWLLTTGVTCAAVMRRRTMPPLARALPLTGVAVMGALVDRVAPLYAIVALWFAAGQWSARTDIADNEREVMPVRPPGAALIDTAVVTAVWLVLATGVVRCLPVSGAWAPDLEAASALDDARVRGRLVLPFNWGEYAIWHWGPRLLVSIDGRRETIYSDAALAAQSAMAIGTPDGLRHLADIRPDYVWLPLEARARTGEWLRANGYRIDVVTDRSFVATRDDHALLVRRPAAARACFP